MRAFLDTANEIGANFFDHANIYSHGRAEEVFGRVLKDRPSLRDQIILQSKCGIRLANQPAGTPFRYDFSHDHIVESVEGILQRLSTDHLDILLLHRPDPLMEGEEVARAFAYLKKAGMVRYFGVSNQNRFQMEYLQSFLPDPLVANQMEMNILHSGFAEAQISVNQNSPLYPAGWEGMVEYCSLKGVSLQAWSPLARGLLSGRDTSGNERATKTATVVSELSEKYGAPPEAVVLAWLLRHPAGIQPVIGTSKPDRLRACAKAVDLNLSREDWYKLFEAGRGAKVP
jgi:predicted oxidoreductase